MWSSLVLLGVVVSICFAAPIRSVADLAEKPRFGALPDPKYTPGSALARSATHCILYFCQANFAPRKIRTLKASGILAKLRTVLGM